MALQMVITCENTLSSMALRSLLSDVVPGIEVVCYRSAEEFRNQSSMVAHIFVSANILFHNPELFQPYMRRTFVLTEGEASPFVQSGFRTIDITVSEQHIVRQILEIQRSGHPGGCSAAHQTCGHDVAENMPMEESPQLSAREKDVLALLVKGYINKEIADKLSISLATVIFHRNNICDKLNTRSLGRLTIYAVLKNIVSLSDL